MNNKKELWQFFTPEYIANFMIELLKKNYDIVVNNNINFFEPSFWNGIFLKKLINNWSNNRYNINWTEIDVDLYNNVNQSINCFKQNSNIKLYNNDFFDIIKKYKQDKIKFDIIIWNPPYIKNNKINKNTINKIKNVSNYKWSWNLYYYFIKESIKLLKNGGLLIFITPITFLTNTYAKNLRNFLYEQGKFLAIYSLEEKKIFKDADIETAIFVYKKDNNNNNNNNNNIEIWIIKKDFNTNNKQISKEDFNIIKIDHFTKDNPIWSIHDKFINNQDSYKNEYNISNIIINDIFNVSVWMVSWYDKAFLINNKNVIDNFNINEQKYLINLVKADILYKDKFVPHKYIFIPKWKYKTENDFKKACPNIYNFLVEYKKKLENRYWSKSLKWWEWATVRNKEVFEDNNEYFFIPNITRKKIWFKRIQYRNDCILYGWWNLITLTFKKNIPEDDKDEYRKLITSKNFTDKINNLVPRKWWRKLFSQSFIANLIL